MTELSPDERLKLARRLIHAYNYSYEATMGDYSIGSIERARNQLDAIRTEIRVAGLTEDELIQYNPALGYWEVLP